MAIWFASECGDCSAVPNLNISGDSEVTLSTHNVVTGFDAESLGCVPFVCLSHSVPSLRHSFD